MRVEFQGHGSPHIHSVLWVKDAPKYGIDSNQKVCEFIDKYISASIPDDDNELKDLVVMLQKHRHSSYCARNGRCHFGFPKPPSDYTLIAEPLADDEDPNAGLSEEQKQMLAKVRKIVSENNLTFDQVLSKAGVGQTAYHEALKISTKGTVIALKRNPNECCVNNPTCLLGWNANTDIQFVLNAYACITYVASYMMKAEKAMGQLLKQVAEEHRTDDLKTKLNKVGAAFLTHREVSAQEAMYRALSMPMKHLSRSVVFTNTNPKDERIAVLKDKNE